MGNDEKLFRFVIILWVCCILASLAATGFIAWAIYALVTHFA